MELLEQHLENPELKQGIWGCIMKQFMAALCHENTEEREKIDAVNMKNSGSWLKHWDFILLDLLCLQLAYVFSVVFRNGWHYPFETSLYVQVAMVIAMADICTMFFTEGYRGIMRRGYFLEFVAVLKHVVLVLVIEVFYLFISKNGGEFSRLSFLIFGVASIISVYAERVLWKTYLLKHKKIFYHKKALLILTSSDRAEQVIRNVLNYTYNELEIIGAVIADKDDLKGSMIEGIPVVSNVEAVPDYIQTRWVDDILINVKRDILLPAHLEEICVGMGVTVHRNLSDQGTEFHSQKLDKLGGYYVLSSSISMASPGQLMLKRVLDICGGIVGLVLTGILAVLIGPAIYLASPGPILFSQIRVGKNGRRFKIYKFRSMYMDAEKRKKELMDQNEMQGFMFKMEADPRIIGSGSDGTRHGLGWFIRKTSIDEFPQFWNVLKGDMSLVGTRPPTEDEWKQYHHHHRARMAIKPGITGMWQVSGRNNITDFEEVVKLDVEYIRNWNLGMDIKILMKTVLMVFRGKGAK